jgi:hypothetical protein
MHCRLVPFLCDGWPSGHLNHLGRERPLFARPWEEDRMSSLVIAAPVTLIAFPFSLDRRRPWWRRLIQSLGQLGRALAAARQRRRGIRFA